MGIYRYPQGSVIDEVTFVKSDGGSLRAYLHALPDTSEKTLGDISLAMAKRGWQTVPNSMNGKATLEVRGFGRTKQVTDILSENGWAKGKPQITEDKKDNSKLWDKVKKRSLFLSGVTYLVGDYSFIKYGLKDENNKLKIAAGFAYFGGTLSSLLFARKDSPDLQIKEIAGKMAKHMQEQNINLPDDCSLNSITQDKHKSKIKTADDLFRRYPAELMNTFFAIAGACIAAAALKETKSPDRNKLSAWLDVGLGSMTMASATFGNLVEEKVHDPDIPRKQGLPGIWEWIQERPLAVTGVGYMVSTMLHVASTTIDMKGSEGARREAVSWRALFVASALISEALVAISSKGHGKGVVSDKSVDNSVISLSAELIAKQPPAQHEYLIDYMSGFLGRDDVLAKKDTEVKDLLRAQVELVKKNPWAHCKDVSPPKPAVKNELFVPLPEDNKWQAVVAKSIPQNSPTASL
ncbi:MAG: hypothetical protein ABL867_00575 [Rickettsiales bacterium]